MSTSQTMENQLENSSCLVGSFEPFIITAENQNSNPRPPIPMCLSPERKPVLKRRTTTAKLRLSQITHESVCLIEQRVHHRDECVRKIQHEWRNFRCRLQSRRDLIAHSKLLVHYQVLTHLLTQQHAKKCLAARTQQQWWRCQRARRRAAVLCRVTQQGRWSPRQAHQIQGSS